MTMAAKDDTSKDQTTRNQTHQTFPLKRHASKRSKTSAQGCYKSAACCTACTATLIDESVERLDSVRIGPMIDAIKQNSSSWDRSYRVAPEKLGSSFDDEVGESRVIYMH
jgi:hypothetical protein